MNYTVCSYCRTRAPAHVLAAGQLCHCCQRGFMKPEKDNT